MTRDEVILTLLQLRAVQFEAYPGSEVLGTLAGRPVEALGGWLLGDQMKPGGHLKEAATVGDSGTTGIGAPIILDKGEDQLGQGETNGNSPGTVEMILFADQPPSTYALTKFSARYATSYMD